MKQIAIIGATASGKTALALELAPLLNAVILSLDSLCVYKEISVASAKPSPDELASIKHFGVDLKSVDEDFSAGEFFCEYKRACEFCKAQGKNLIITGGSGFYLKALISGLAPRVKRASFYPQNNEIFALAKSCDSEFCAKYSAKDTFRLQKWFDIYSFLGNSSLGNSRIPSEFLKANTKEPLIKNIEIYELCWEKELLKERIKKRTCAMLDS
ncbi:MAG: isopentenyl transferase family protein, partial [Campylobacter sp.]|nr:isopentenyl transferase family protein [Campylobacter sp.]